MLYRRYTLILFTLCAVTANGAIAQSFGNYQEFPDPAPFSFGVVGGALPDGRLVVWNGDTVYLQYDVGVDSFTPIATGYVGDPAFLAVRPDGHSLLLGQGWLGAVYALDVFNPSDFEPSSIVTTLSHFSGALLTSNLLLLDVGTESFSSALEIVDLSGAKSGTVAVVTKSDQYAGTKELVSDKPPSSYSANVFLDEDNGILYAMDGNTRELRFFSLTVLINAFNTQTPLDWATDGTLVGAPRDFFSRGVSGITPGGLLVIGGSEGFLQPGGIQLVDPRLDDPDLATVVDTLDPAGTQPFYIAIYNHVTDTITARTDGGEVFAPETALQTVPALGMMGTLILALFLSTVIGSCLLKNRTA